MAGLPRKSDPNLLVGFETSDDAGVYRLGGDIAIVVTADFITPPVDDPFAFGRIGAANSLSDVYAMGGRPVACLNLIGFPEEDLGPEVLHGIVEADELLPEARRMAEHLASFAPFVPRTMKAMVNFGMEASLAGALMLEKYAQGALVQTEDKAEGISAFLEKRPPQFKGR